MLTWVGPAFAFAFLMLASCPHSAVAQSNTFPTTGNVGVGTTTPSYPFEVQANTQWAARFRKTDATHGGIIVDAATGYNPNLAMSVNGAVKWYMNNNVANGDTLQFWESTGNYPRFTLSQGGYVGVGTTSPGVYMDLKGNNVPYGGQIRLQATDYTQITFYNSNNPALNSANRLGHIYYDIANSSLFMDSNVGNKRLLLNAAGGGGNVGVGLVNPSYKLDVNGSFNATSINLNGSPLTGSQWSNSGSSINYSGGNVGVGISSPLYSLDVNGGTNGFRAKAATGSANDTIATFESAGGIQAIFRANGNVGLGTVNPIAKLHVVGDGKVTGNLTVDGNIAAKYQDLAEWVPSTHALPAGTVVTLDPTQSNHVEASSKSYDTRVAGVISSQPGIALGEAGENKVLVATTGRVKLKVDASHGAIQVGDLLVTSDVPGVAMKSQPISLGGVDIHRPGTIIGKALEPLAKGRGEILALLSIQ